MSISTGFSLWLQPIGQAYDRLADIIKQLSEQYHTPLFEPHVTLIGGLIGKPEALVTRTAQLAKFIRPSIVTLTTVDYLDEYFRCLFATVEKTKWLADANTKARKIFHREDDPEFMPHLSLMYGDLSPTTKQRIIVEIGSRLEMSFPTTLHLWSTNGTPQEWYKVQEFSLGETRWHSIN